MWDEGRRVHDAWDKNPRYGGQRVGQFQLTSRPYWERLEDMPEADLEAEGGLWMSIKEFVAMFPDPEENVAVVRFKLLDEESDAEK
jgi:hypothetical protein